MYVTQSTVCANACKRHLVSCQLLCRILLQQRTLPGVCNLQLEVVWIGSLKAVDEVAVANAALNRVPADLPPAVSGCRLIQVSALALRAEVSHNGILRLLRHWICWMQKEGHQICQHLVRQVLCQDQSILLGTSRCNESQPQMHEVLFLQENWQVAL